MPHIELPEPEAGVLRRRAIIIEGLKNRVGMDVLIVDEDGRRAYETDAFTAYRCMPMLVVLPRTTEEVSKILKYCNESDVKVIPRGAGTSLCGGALPSEDAIVLCISKMNRVLEIDFANRFARVEAGITNLEITARVAERGFFYAPDPSSQLACTLAGNLAMNSGGAHCLKYGVTTHNVLGVKMVLIDGTIVEIGGTTLDRGGYDLLSLVIGSEGQLGVITEATVKIVPSAEASRPMMIGFRSPEAAGSCVAAIIAAGIIPVAIEYMDRAATEVCEAFAGAGYPLDAEALLIVEVEGSENEIGILLGRIAEIAARHDPKTVTISSNPYQSARIWAGRKAAFGAIGRISDYLCMDGVIPLSQLPHALTRISQICAEHGLRVANIFHAGDGNLHPLILYDANSPDEADRAEVAGAAILRLCVELVGCLTVLNNNSAPRPNGPRRADAHQERVRSAMAAEPGQSLSAECQRGSAHRACRKYSRGGVANGAIVTELLRPAVEWELQSMIAKLASQKRDMEVVGHGALRNAGRAAKSDVVLSTSGLKGVTLYEPTEIVMSARAGTPVYEIEAILAARGQMLAFEPVDLGPATGAPDGALSIGGVFATNFSGSRRIAAGSARDNLLGVRAVNGRGEIFKSGGRVMKNVTGLDVARGLTGSWGTLAVMTEVTFKVAPLPHTMVTLAYTGLPDDLGIEALTVAMGTPLEVSGAVHLPKNCASRLKQAKLKGLDEPVTLLRLENFSAAVDERKDKLKAALKVYGNPIELDAEQTWNLWSEFRALSVMPFSNETSLWRISALPTKAAEIVSAIQKFMDVVAFYDWAGALIWLEVPVTADSGAADVRRAVSVRGGHATLILAKPEVRASVDVFEPLKPEIERLTRGIKSAFDPDGLLNRGRMYANI